MFNSAIYEQIITELEELESPQYAFLNRLPIETKLRTGVRLFGL